MVTCGARDSAWNGTSTWRVPPRRFARPSTSRATPLFNRVVQVSTSTLEQYSISRYLPKLTSRAQRGYALIICVVTILYNIDNHHHQILCHEE